MVEGGGVGLILSRLGIWPWGSSDGRARGGGWADGHCGHDEDEGEWMGGWKG